MLEALKRLAKMTPSRRRQWLTFKLDLAKTRTIYAPKLLRCGTGTIVQKPLFWTPECIEIGSRVLIWRGCRIEGQFEYGNEKYTPRIIIRDGVSFQQNCHITAAGTIVIGAGSSIMFGVMITDIDHDYEHPELNALRQELSVKRTEIGRNCFIGAGAKIQAGTRLGDQCVVGTNAVVRGDFPDHCVIVGVPARIVKRYDQDSRSWRKTDLTGAFV